jgi:transposase
MTWIERFAKVYAQKPEPEGRALVVELDEMRHFLKKRPTSSGPGRLGIVLRGEWLTGSWAVVTPPP